MDCPRIEQCTLEPLEKKICLTSLDLSISCSITVEPSTEPSKRLWLTVMREAIRRNFLNTFFNPGDGLLYYILISS